MNQPAYFNWTNDDYERMVMHILFYLEPFEFNKNELIYNELDEVLCIHFVNEGSVMFGYEFNKKQKLILSVKNFVYGVFEVTYNKRSCMLIKAETYINGYFIRKKFWLEIKKIFPRGWEMIKRREFMYMKLLFTISEESLTSTTINSRGQYI